MKNGGSVVDSGREDDTTNHPTVYAQQDIAIYNLLYFIPPQLRNTINKIPNYFIANPKYR